MGMLKVILTPTIGGKSFKCTIHSLLNKMA